jgi:hypothetical protein
MRASKDANLNVAQVCRNLDFDPTLYNYVLLAQMGGIWGHTPALPPLPPLGITFGEGVGVAGTTAVSVPMPPFEIPVGEGAGAAAGGALGHPPLGTLVGEETGAATGGAAVSLPNHPMEC